MRALDLFPRVPGPAETLSPNTPGRSRSAVYSGDGEAPVVEPPRAEAAPSSDGYNLNFENAPVSTVAKVILGDILGVGYTIDPRIQGTISLTSGRPIQKSDILYVLENALRLSNVVLVRDRTGYRLVPAGEAVGTGAMDKISSAEPGFGITVIPLRYVSAQTIIKLLDGFAVKAGMMRADAARNILILQGSGAERRNAIEIVASFDADWMTGQSVGIYPVHNSTPEPIIAELEKIMDTGADGLGQNQVRLQPIGRLNAILVVSRKPAALRLAGTWIARLDQSDTAATNLKVYRLQYGYAPQVAALLTDIFFGRGTSGLDTSSSQIAPGAGVSTQSSASPLTALSVPPPAGTSATSSAATPSATPAGANGRNTGVTPGGSLSEPDGLFSRSPRGTAAGSSAILPGVRITADAINNSILVFANQEGHRIIKQTLRQIDRPQMQVAIEATVAEITLNDTLNYGVQFYLQSHNIGLPIDKGSIINSAAGAVLGQALPGFNFLVGSSAAPNLILDALHNVTDVKVLSNPSVVVLNNQSATLQVGDQIPVSTGTATVLTANNTVVNTIDYRNTGIILRVTPRINSNGNVVLDVEQEISNVSSGSSGNTLTPTVSQRRVKSTIAVASGQTVLLAGLIKEQENLTKSGIPILDQIPGIGNLFSNTTKSKARTEVILFIRPQIIRNSADANVVAEELRTKMNGRITGTNARDVTRELLGLPNGQPPLR